MENKGLHKIVLKNAIQCRKCGDIIESMMEQEFRRCKCGSVAVDGAFKYLRRCGNPENMMRPAFDKGDKVEFLFNGTGEALVGCVEVVDGQGTFGQSQEPSYDIRVLDPKHCFYKHVRESWILRKLHQEEAARGILQYDPKTEYFSVLYSRDGYAALIDQPYMDVRLVGTMEWIPHAEAPLREWIGRRVELRNRTT